MGDRRSDRRWRAGALLAVGLALSACGTDTTPAAESLPPPTDSAVASSDGAPTAATERVAEVASPLLEQADDGQRLGQPVIWPAPDVVVATPEEAAADFVSSLLISEGEPILGEFRQADARSGEIPVLFAGESGDLDPPQEQGLLFVRQLGPEDGWYVIAAVSDGVRIDTPSTSDQVPAGAVSVAGDGRGFEGTLAVSAFPPGDATAPFDTAIGAGGAFDELEPYAVDLDLSGAPDGGTVVILVRGDTGLGNDPGSFAAIPVVAAPTTPNTTATTVVIPETE